MGSAAVRVRSIGSGEPGTGATPRVSGRVPVGSYGWRSTSGVVWDDDPRHLHVRLREGHDYVVVLDAATREKMLLENVSDLSTVAAQCCAMAAAGADFEALWREFQDRSALFLIELNRIKAMPH